MSHPAIRIDGLWKEYVIGGAPAGRTFREMVTDSLGAPLRWLRGEAGTREEERFWALRDVSLEIGQGEVVGIIGRNGAGKSTLLKILSRITAPTRGRVEIRGRIASLLEVGTGFHPELTGRENVYLNGSILGMSRAEIRTKFDEIVAFAGVEKFIDTPVKRYSSGMQVRLAFAVAAHLDPEILLIDEVLAVGDAEFQSKCMGKMDEVAHAGRTVVLVSHNLAAIESLTKNAVLLDAGMLRFSGSTGATLEEYTNSVVRGVQNARVLGKRAYSNVVETRVRFDDNASGIYKPGSDLVVEVVVETDGRKGVSLDLSIVASLGQVVAFYSTQQFDGVTVPDAPGAYRIAIRLNGLLLAAGAYRIQISIGTLFGGYDTIVEDAASFEVLYCNPGRLTWNFSQSAALGLVALSRAAHSPLDFHPAIERA